MARDQTHGLGHRHGCCLGRRWMRTVRRNGIVRGRQRPIDTHCDLPVRKHLRSTPRDCPATAGRSHGVQRDGRWPGGVRPGGGRGQPPSRVPDDVDTSSLAHRAGSSHVACDSVQQESSWPRQPVGPHVRMRRALVGADLYAWQVAPCPALCAGVWWRRTAYRGSTRGGIGAARSGPRAPSDLVLAGRGVGLCRDRGRPRRCQR